MALNIGFYAYAIIGHTRADQISTTAFDGAIWYFAYTM